VKISPIGTRFLMPIYPLVWVLVLGVARFAPKPLRGIAAVLPLLSIAHTAGIGIPELAKRNAEFGSTALQASATHIPVGFDASPSARAVSAFIGEVARSDAPSLSSIFPMPRGGQHARLARSLLFRESSVGSARFDLATADELSLTFGDGASGPSSRLSYVDLPITGQDSLDPQTLLGHLFTAMLDRERDAHWLLTPVGGDPLRRTGDLVGGPLVLRERRELGAYNAYRFELRSPSSAETR
jgi:hypothetical protein